MFTEDELEHLREHLSHYPERRAGAIYCLYAVQDKIGYIDDKGIMMVTELTGLSKTQLEELITFFTLLRRRPVGRNVLRICDSISCHVMGSRQVLEAAEAHTGVALGEISRTGSVTILPSICLGLCNHAPAALLNDEDEVSRLTPESVQKLLDELDQQPFQQSATGSQVIATSGHSMLTEGRDH
ncbi:MAG: NAD(P)H-dependent oxidoreductase subunit E [Endozoicomonadaceae bacterium]|nr:NAD(P)H-dependent oxidoreductase subunit E [Endozoicomonadaceae bacterium]